MKVNCFQLDESSRLKRIQVETFLNEQGHGEGIYWVDLEFNPDDDCEEWLDRLGVKDLSRRLCLEAWNRPGYYALRSETFLVFPLSDQVEGEEGNTSCAFLCRENLLITLHPQPLLSQDSFTEFLEVHGGLSQPEIAGLVSALMMEISMRDQSAVNRLRNRVFELDDRMGRDPDSVAMNELAGIRSAFLVLATRVGDQIPAIKALSGTKRPFLPNLSESEYLNCATVNLQACESTLHGLDGRISSLVHAFQMHAQNKSSRRLDTLTVLSAIFMPITLMAGIWGMNFESMPELSWPHGYLLGLGSMALVATVMFLFFRKNGWFS